jgi:hypothetical protein
MGATNSPDMKYAEQRYSGACSLHLQVPLLLDIIRKINTILCMGYYETTDKYLWLVASIIVL